MQKSQKAYPGARGVVMTKVATSSRHANMQHASLVSLVGLVCVEIHAFTCQRDSTAAYPSLNRWSSRRIIEETSSWHIAGGQIRALIRLTDAPSKFPLIYVLPRYLIRARLASTGS